MVFQERKLLKVKVFDKQIQGHIMFSWFVTASLATLVLAQGQTGFISIDCGLKDKADYTNEETGINYISDATLIDTGVSYSISPEYKTYAAGRQQETLRSFPEGDRNCYKVGLKRDSKYLIRATFMYGNYDRQNILPQFDLHIGPNKWVTVDFKNASDSLFTDIIHVPKMSRIHVCLINTGSGTPFISALELRPLSNASYVSTSGSLALLRRYDIGSTTNETVRYPADVYDRVWTPFHLFKLEDLNTSQEINSYQNNFRPAPVVMSSAGTPINASEPLEFSIVPLDPTQQVYFYLHFAEVVELRENQSRQFNIYLNGKMWSGPIVPYYLYTRTIYSRSASAGPRHEISLYKTGGSTLPPLINAIEAYYVVELSESETDEKDVDAVANIKSVYGINRNWQGDPCVPQTYLWDGIDCSYRDNDTSRIISLSLSSYGLTGEITSYISDLTQLQSLDLSNNSLNGTVPGFLALLPSLRVLNLSGNNLTGSVPPELIERSNGNSLELSLGGNPDLCSLDGNPDLCTSMSSKKKHKPVVAVVTSVAATIIIVFVAAAVLFWKIKGRNQKVLLAGEKDANSSEAHNSMESKNRCFSKAEVIKITNNFQRVLGRGGFGTVYHGYLDDTQVAVKMLSPSSAQGYKQFRAEVKLLLRVHHRNLTNLIGFCDEDSNVGLIYEYMANGDLEEHLSDRNRGILSWERRLQIAVDAAKGLEYLHNGCKPLIVHRDVKTSNILLNENFQAKLADFGLSRAFPVEDGSHVSTAVVGTPGYLDPEYHVSSWLTEKSDVYSFGIVLLRVITGRPVIVKTDDRARITQWVSSMLANGDIQNIVDPRLGAAFRINSVWKAVEIAMACASATPAGRPTMTQVVTELTECLVLATAPTNPRNQYEPNIFSGVIDESVPSAR